MYLGVLGIESKNFKTLQAKLRNYQHLQSFTQISIPCYVYHPCESTVIRMVNTLFQVILRVILYYCPHFAVSTRPKVTELLMTESGFLYQSIRFQIVVLPLWINERNNSKRKIAFLYWLLFLWSMYFIRWAFYVLGCLVELSILSCLWGAILLCFCLLVINLTMWNSSMYLPEYIPWWN